MARNGADVGDDRQDCVRIPDGVVPTALVTFLSGVGCLAGELTEATGRIIAAQCDAVVRLCRLGLRRSAEGVLCDRSPVRSRGDSRGQGARTAVRLVKRSVLSSWCRATHPKARSLRVGGGREHLFVDESEWTNASLPIPKHVGTNARTRAHPSAMTQREQSSTTTTTKYEQSSVELRAAVASVCISTRSPNRAPTVE